MVIKINTDGAAFHADALDKAGNRDEMLDRFVLSTELDRLFREIYSSIRHDAETKGSLIDINGNKVGYWNLELEGEPFCNCSARMEDSDNEN